MGHDHDDGEVQRYEQASDPLALALNKAQRRKASQHGRGLRSPGNRIHDRTT